MERAGREGVSKCVQMQTKQPCSHNSELCWQPPPPHAHLLATIRPLVFTYVGGASSGLPDVLGGPDSSLELVVGLSVVDALNTGLEDRPLAVMSNAARLLVVLVLLVTRCKEEGLPAAAVCRTLLLVRCVVVVVGHLLLLLGRCGCVRWGRAVAPWLGAWRSWRCIIGVAVTLPQTYRHPHKLMLLLPITTWCTAVCVWMM